MSMVETVVRRQPWEVSARLAELQLGPIERLLRVRSVAISASADATPFHPANAAGTLAYQHGTFALRDEYCRRRGEDAKHAAASSAGPRSGGSRRATSSVSEPVWRLDRPDGVEVIVNDALKIRVIFANVDVACNDDMKPKPRSRKGAGAERVCVGNLFGSLPEFAPRQPDGWATFYLMVDECGAAELTRPVVKYNTFSAYIERNYLSNGDDLDHETLSLDDDGDVADGFDPEVVRK
jgi:hypothetical protein